MNSNVGTVDRGIRLLIGLVALAMIFVGPFSTSSVFRILIGAVGVIMVVTSGLKFCPIYRLFGLRTCSIDR